jgi:ribosomal protein S18 acetylase RimI-like enzyme
MVSSDADYAQFAELIREYVDWCRDRYAHDSWFVEQTFSHQSLDRELEKLALSYGPPKGKSFLSFRDDTVTGGVAYRGLNDDICEMKRLYVRPQFHGARIASRLCNELIDDARRSGFSLMRLDTANRFHEAIALYRSIGFAECVPYNEYPEAILPHIVFMEMRLD